MKNPIEDCPNDELCKELTIQCTFEYRDYGGKRVNGWQWRVYIPELKYETWTKNLTKTLAKEIAIVEESNEELLLGEVAWHKDPTKLWETTHHGTDHAKIQDNKVKKAMINMPPPCDTPGLSRDTYMQGHW